VAEPREDSASGAPPASSPAGELVQVEHRAQAVGEAPGHYVERIRTEAARRQLQETDDTVVAIAARCGFGTAETMRRNFIRRVGISPDQYRKAFA